MSLDWKKTEMPLKVPWYKIVKYKFQSSFYDKQSFNDWLKFWLMSEIASWSCLHSVSIKIRWLEEYIQSKQIESNL